MADKLIFIVDKNEAICKEVTAWLQEIGFQAKVFEDTELCFNTIDQNPSAICLDMNTSGPSGLSGLEFLKRLRLTNRDIPIMVVTENGDLDSAVEVMKLGAFDYMVKPVEKARLITNIQRAIAMHTMVHKIDRLRGEIEKKHVYKNIIGQSEAIQRVFTQIEEVAEININVLVEGESGTGKELAAKAIHYGSAYKTGPFIAINCGAIPESLQESEFFGHEKGSFTGADHARIGKLEYANNGSLFLDEVGEMSQEMQVKLLRFLQDKTFERLGGNKKINVDLRIISATNRKLEQEVKRGKFREDLYYRLVVYPITMPPLRDRKEDIPLLVNYFLKKFKNEISKIITSVSSSVMESFMKYDWKGNVRQLENVIYRSMVATRTETIELENLPSEIQQNTDHNFITQDTSQNQPTHFATPEPSKAVTATPTIQEMEKNALIKALKISAGNIEQAAKSLGISRATCYRKIKKYQID
ncbi:MAG: sigma-54-dependent Fis family transcriptional regulator [Nitrospina sp.]|nr:sigma-54-dependent Fis family transcriptional regulator [Nitrospina sp.]MBT6601052.1 sigma-54-dependent Fis family transcriptional regulator [Nitrospina sp.]